MKALFDTKSSLEQCPPIFSDGVTWKKRIVLPRNLVSYLKQYNPRELNIVSEKIPALRDSFIVNGFINSCPPPTIKVDPNNKDRFIGLSGYHRNIAAEQAEWHTLIYDVVEFDSPKDERIHRVVTNHHKTPFTENTNDDIVKQTREAVANGEVLNDDDEIKQFISIIASDKTAKDQKIIYKKVRRHTLLSATLLTYHSGNGENSTKEFALKYNIPYRADAAYEQLDELGYITVEKHPKIMLHDAKKLSDEYDGKEISIYAYIKSPLGAPKLYKQRKEYKETFEKFIMDDCRLEQSKMARMGIDVNLDVIIKNHPIKFKGFLAQDISADPLNNGNPKEQGVVDVYGNMI